MAVRIPVVLSQHERRSGAVADYEEKLITQLIFEAGLDATLVADLKSIELDTTDHLCIEGLKGEFALATWQSKEYVCEHLHRLGIGSLQIVPMDGSERLLSNLDGSNPKSIYFVFLSTHDPIEITIRTLRDLRLAKSTPVFSIGMPSSSPKKSGTTASLEPRPSIVDLKKQDFVRPTESKVLPDTSNIGMDLEDDFPNIDQLMDDLDQFEM